MTQGTTSKDTFESTRELERTIAEGLWAARPRDLAWDKFTVDYMETGSMGRFVAIVYQDRQIVGRQSISHDMFWAAKRLRQGMYSPGKGTWLSMTLTVTPAGRGWEASYNYNEKPSGNSGTRYGLLRRRAVPLPPRRGPHPRLVQGRNAGRHLDPRLRASEMIGNHLTGIRLS